MAVQGRNLLRPQRNYLKIMSDKAKLLNCYMDLQRASVSVYKNPLGDVHKTFMNHSITILESISSENCKKYCRQLKKLITTKDYDRKLYADKLLTLGLLIKP